MKNLRNSLLLFIAALIWGTAFVFQSMGADSTQPFTFYAARSFLGFLVLLPFVAVRLRRASSGKAVQQSRSIPKNLTLLAGVCCGVMLTVAGTLQQYGMSYTTVGKAGFITTLYIILTPIFGLFIRKKCPFTVWIGAAAAVVGMYLLCVQESFSISSGDFIMLLCAASFAVHILLVDYFAPKTDAIVLACLQFLVSSILSTILALLFEHPQWSQITEGLIPILYTGIMSSGVAFTLQVVAQKDFNPTIAAMLMSLESVISLIASYIAYALGFLTTDQSMSASQIIGCVIMFASVIFVQLPIKGKPAQKN